MAGENAQDDVVDQMKTEYVLTGDEVKLLAKARAGGIPCPWCGQPLTGERVTLPTKDNAYRAEVRLSCRCDFVEY